MKLSVAIEKGKQKNWLKAQIRRNPSERAQWFVMMVDLNLQSTMLVDDNDAPILSSDLNIFVDLMDDIEIPEFTVYL